MLLYHTKWYFTIVIPGRLGSYFQMSQAFQEGERYFPYTKNLAESVSIDRGQVINAKFE
jgi:hypothetical protein